MLYGSMAQCLGDGQGIIPMYPLVLLAVDCLYPSQIQNYHIISARSGMNFLIKKIHVDEDSCTYSLEISSKEHIDLPWHSGSLTGSFHM